MYWITERGLTALRRSVRGPLLKRRLEPLLWEGFPAFLEVPDPLLDEEEYGEPDFPEPEKRAPKPPKEVPKPEKPKSRPLVDAALDEFQSEAVREMEDMILELDPDGFQCLAETAAHDLWSAAGHGRKRGSQRPSAAVGLTAGEAEGGLRWLQNFAKKMKRRNKKPWTLFLSGKFAPEAMVIVRGLPGRVTVMDARAMAELMWRNGVGTAPAGVMEAKELDGDFFESL
jgi:restriction endonuclease Mrr